ncbi:MAG TPA: MFS transporter [Gammaproteobacteria bacterium]|nr:MFS transporter [Gammaproteobacteria bacterium]
MRAELSDRRVIAWAFYDWANSAFATTVMAGFFPLFFKLYWSKGADVTVSTFNLGVANSLASLTLVVLAPVLGAIADCGGAKKKFLAFFTFLGVVMTGSLYFVAAGEWLAAAILYALAAVGFSGGIIFYDSLIVSIADERRVDFVSGCGYALGYLGGGILFAVNVWMTLDPALFGFADAGEAVRTAFVTVAVWWALFAIPLFLFVPEPPVVQRVGGLEAVRAGFAQLVATLRELQSYRTVVLFLLAYWFYIDGVDTIIRMAVDYGLSLGFDSNSLIVALLIVQFIGFPAAVAFGWLGERIGPKRGIFIAIGVYLGVTLWATALSHVWQFYAMAVIVGLVQGGIQALSRSYYARLIPPDKAAEFFGFYNMLGKFAAVIGPMMMGWVGLIFGSPRLAILSIALLFLVGGTLLYFVEEKKGG